MDPDRDLVITINPANGQKNRKHHLYGIMLSIEKNFISTLASRLPDSTLASRLPQTMVKSGQAKQCVAGNVAQSLAIVHL